MTGDSSSYDLIVIGSGPGGYVAALRAAQLEMRTLVVEKDPQPGGTCLHRGCIPTKAWLHTASLYEEIGKAAEFGVRISERPRFDPIKARAYRERVVQKNAKGIEFLFRRGNVDLVRGVGRLASERSVVVETAEGPRTVEGRHVLIATGSVPQTLPAAPIDGEAVLDSDQVLELDSVPRRLVVLGAGAVGVEFASIFAALGSEVTVVELLPRLLPLEDEEVSAELERCFRRRGIEVRTGTRLMSTERRPEGGVRLELEHGGELSELDTDVLLVAVGRQPVIETVGLEVAGVHLDGRCIAVNETMQTNIPSIYAIGDVVATPWLAHVASAEGILAVEHMAGLEVEPIDYDKIPSCTYCEPEVASVGLSEAEARRRGHDVATGKFPFSASGKAAILGRTAGFVKIVRERRFDELLGVHIVGPHATDLIAEACVALRLESTTEEIFRTIHAHPTLSEAMAEAAHAALGRALHA